MEIINALGEYYGICKYEYRIYFYKSIFDRLGHDVEMSYESLFYELKITNTIKSLCNDIDMIYIPTAYKIIENDNYEELEGEYILLMEYIEDMIPLHKFISDDDLGIINRKLIVKHYDIIEKIANCIEYLESKNIVHGDINDNNIQFDPINNKIVVIDWEMAEVTDDQNAKEADWMGLYGIFKLNDTACYNKDNFLKLIKEKYLC